MTAFVLGGVFACVLILFLILQSQREEAQRWKKPKGNPDTDKWWE